MAKPKKMDSPLVQKTRSSDNIYEEEEIGNMSRSQFPVDDDYSIEEDSSFAVDYLVGFEKYETAAKKSKTTVDHEKEVKDCDDTPTNIGKFLNMGFSLPAANAKGSNQLTVDYGGLSSHPTIESSENNHKIMELQAELLRTKSENHKLMDMLIGILNGSKKSANIEYTIMQQKKQQAHKNYDNDPHGNESEVVENNKFQQMMDPMELNKMFCNSMIDDNNNSISKTDLDQLGSRQLKDEPCLLNSKPMNPYKMKSILNNADEEIIKRSQDMIDQQVDRHHSPPHGNRNPHKVARLGSETIPTANVEQTAEATMRKARVSVRARSEGPMITDGCQWRKYGQKMAKGNPCPRAYYRCTMAVGCPVRKQVQRCAEDRTILITTYEGNHSHPLPPAAMVMASQTSSVAQMLLSGSIPSADNITSPNLLAHTLLPCSSMATISASAPFPTVTLDLTQNPSIKNNLLHHNQIDPTAPIGGSSMAATSLQFHDQNGPSHLARTSNEYPTGSAALLPQILGHAFYNQSKFYGLQMSTQNGSCNDYNMLPQPPPSSSSLANTVKAAITSDPSFKIALEAAITSIIGDGVNPRKNGLDNSNTG